MTDIAVEVEQAFEASGASARAARGFVARSIAALSLETDEVILLTSELVTNALMHARTEFVVTVAVDDRVILVSVRDDNSRLPVRVHAPLDATSGRGLGLVDAVADSWGVRTHDGGKAVWFEMRCAPRGAGGCGPAPSAGQHHHQVT